MGFGMIFFPFVILKNKFFFRNSENNIFSKSTQKLRLDKMLVEEGIVRRQGS